MFSSAPGNKAGRNQRLISPELSHAGCRSATAACEAVVGIWLFASRHPERRTAFSRNHQQIHNADNVHPDPPLLRQWSQIFPFPRPIYPRPRRHAPLGAPSFSSVLFLLVLSPESRVQEDSRVRASLATAKRRSYTSDTETRILAATCEVALRLNSRTPVTTKATRRLRLTNCPTKTLAPRLRIALHFRGITT